MTPIIMIAAGLFGAYLVLWPTGTDQTKLEIFLSALGAKDPAQPDTSASQGAGDAAQGIVQAVLDAINGALKPAKDAVQKAQDFARDPVETVDPQGSAQRRSNEPWGQGSGGAQTPSNPYAPFPNPFPQAPAPPSSGFDNVLPRSSTEGIPVADDAAGANRWGLIP